VVLSNGQKLLISEQLKLCRDNDHVIVYFGKKRIDISNHTMFVHSSNMFSDLILLYCMIFT